MVFHSHENMGAGSAESLISDKRTRELGNLDYLNYTYIIRQVIIAVTLPGNCRLYIT